jgi:glycosyltransferase involved in cell wall biosynthesis
MRVAYISPFINTENKYIDLQKILLSELGFKVEPLSLSVIFSKRLLGLFDKRNVVMVHWLETRLFKVNKGSASLSFVGACQFLIYALVLACCRARVVYVVHDHAVHDTTGFKHALSAWAVKFLRWLADVRIVHDPSFSEPYKAVFAPHPLYWEFESPSGAKTAPPSVAPPADGAPGDRPRYGILGALRPYKGIHKLLAFWPGSTPLLICGKSVGDYGERLQGIIQSKGLQGTVDLRLRFLPDAEFAAILGELDVVVLPHMSDTMLVSGAFFEAMGRVPIILARSSPFIRWVETQYPGVVGFTSDADIEGVIQRVHQRWLSLRGQDPSQFALKAFGRETIIQSYRTIFA